jgi:hypothetical protein
MTTRVRVRLASPDDSPWVDAEGASIPSAVRSAARKLGLSPGQTRSRRWLDTHELAWDWSGTELRVRVSRSGPSGEIAERRRPVVSISLPDDLLQTIDAMAEERRKSRSAVIEELLRKAVDSDG